MIKLIKLEEIAQFILSIIIFNQLDFAWWVFLALLLLPDLSMLGYLFNTKIGAIAYNIFHHKLLGIMLYGLGMWMVHSYVMLAGVILFGHAAMDRIFGYGLKYADDFKHTHLGWIGK
ncbi:DUF4260 domain-containing protein [Belliella sp. DSM 111904]|uniref:DUF4260 domain-containing protein n=1 Tax=Belliella filtrata TaxID=2923435 RepID=A0ABS9V5B6_9BACT|nr:DUF4260 domain-containing protein [Belliella filtrata]MCH7411611.1 DUF4260 domain-containing protein [Belliella filtrata]